jgi:hypothetical protein
MPGRCILACMITEASDPGRFRKYKLAYVITEATNKSGGLREIALVRHQLPDILRCLVTPPVNGVSHFWEL